MSHYLHIRGQFDSSYINKMQNMQFNLDKLIEL
jgi:hypothetical protein